MPDALHSSARNRGVEVHTRLVFVSQQSKTHLKTFSYPDRRATIRQAHGGERSRTALCASPRSASPKPPIPIEEGFLPSPAKIQATVRVFSDRGVFARGHEPTVNSNHELTVATSFLIQMQRSPYPPSSEALERFPALNYEVFDFCRATGERFVAVFCNKNRV